VQTLSKTLFLKAKIIILKAFENTVFKPVKKNLKKNLL